MAENSHDRRKDLHAALIAFIKANKEQFAWGTSSSETGLPSYSEIAKRIDEVLENLEKTYEGVEIERKNGACKLTYATFDGTKKSFTRERDLVSWFDTITINRFIKLEGASAAENKSPIFDYISLFLGYSGFIGFKHNHRLGSDVIEELNPAAAIGGRLLEQDHQKELTTTLKDRILALVQSKATRRLVFFGFLLTIALFSTVLIRNSVVANGECSSEQQLLSAIVMDFDQDKKEPFSTRLVNELRYKATKERPLRVLSGSVHVNTKLPDFQDQVDRICADNCFKTGVVVYGDLEEEFEYIDCQIEVRNLIRADSLVIEEHYFLKDPGNFRFNVPKTASFVADFVWSLLYYFQREDLMAEALLKKLLTTERTDFDESFRSSILLLWGNSLAHRGEFSKALEIYQQIPSTFTNFMIVEHNIGFLRRIMEISSHLNQNSSIDSLLASLGIESADFERSSSDLPDSTNGSIATATEELLKINRREFIFTDSMKGLRNDPRSKGHFVKFRGFYSSEQFRNEHEQSETVALTTYTNQNPNLLRIAISFVQDSVFGNTSYVLVYPMKLCTYWCWYGEDPFDWFKPINGYRQKISLSGLRQYDVELAVEEIERITACVLVEGYDKKGRLLFQNYFPRTKKTDEGMFDD